MYEIKYLTNDKGEKTDVIISYNDYLDMLEEIEDLKTIAERKTEDLIPHHTLKKEILENA